ncbi:MAG: 30S ribosomal protein S17e [Candidatus Aenigmatarchaeota archaeon]
MGRIRTKDIKRAAFQIVNSKECKGDFEGNKAIVNDANLGGSKRDRNRIAGYVTRIKRHGK